MSTKKLTATDASTAVQQLGTSYNLRNKYKERFEIDIRSTKNFRSKTEKENRACQQGYS